MQIAFIFSDCYLVPILSDGHISVSNTFATEQSLLRRSNFGREVADFLLKVVYKVLMLLHGFLELRPYSIRWSMVLNSLKFYHILFLGLLQEDCFLLLSHASEVLDLVMQSYRVGIFILLNIVAF